MYKTLVSQTLGLAVLASMGSLAEAQVHGLAVKDGPVVTDDVNPGWNVLNGLYNKTSAVDGFTFEWQYFMVHDAEFAGSIGYVLVDPKGRLGRPSHDGTLANGTRGSLPFSLMPSGTSVAIGGLWSDGRSFADYERLNHGNTVGSSTKNFVGYDDKGAHFGELTELTPVTAQGGSFSLKGKTASAVWDLVVTPEWTANASDAPNEPFGPITGTDMGYLPGERWTVHMQWPRTRVEGTITDLATGKTHNIAGHGYRENAWGRWNFAVDGWAFAILSDANSKVQWAWQSYHKSKRMDWLDVAFEDQGQAVKRRYFAKDQALSWKLSEWRFDKAARQCVPHNIAVEAVDADYRIKASYSLAGRQLPMLSNTTPLTRIFVIMVHAPYIEGVIENVKTGAVVSRFSGLGGGEFSVTRSLWSEVSEKNCTAWGEKFNREFNR